MWIVVSLLEDKASAKRAKEVLESEGILVNIKPISRVKDFGAYELLVLESESLEARDILSDCGII